MPRRAGLDRGQVVRAAADLVNTEGGGALSLNRIAETLGVQTPSLYNHIAGLVDLQRELRLLNARGLEQRLAEAAIGKSRREAVLSIAQAYRTYALANPGVYLASLQVSGTARKLTGVEDVELEQAEERIVRIAMAVIASFGITGEDGLHAVRGLRSAIHGFVSLEIAGGFGLALDCDESFTRLIETFVVGLEEQSHGLGV
jgi:AcrR family transcriptional regulator